jgi:hypothetical protein
VEDLNSWSFLFHLFCFSFLLYSDGILLVLYYSLNLVYVELSGVRRGGGSEV